MADRVSTALWSIRPDVVVALEDRFGEPVDSYVNGSQTWLLDHGPGGITLEWRLHPVAAYRPPVGLSPYELWETVVASLSAGTDPTRLEIGQEERSLASLWDGLECFPAFGDDVEPGVLAEAAGRELGVAPDRFGMVDHEQVGRVWEQRRGKVSIVALLQSELES